MMVLLSISLLKLECPSCRKQSSREPYNDSLRKAAILQSQLHFIAKKIIISNMFSCRHAEFMHVLLQWQLTGDLPTFFCIYF